MSRPAPTRRIKDSASSATTRVDRHRAVARLSPPRVPRLSDVRRSGREVRSAGKIPNNRPVASDNSAVNATTVLSGATRSTRGRFGTSDSIPSVRMRRPGPRPLQRSQSRGSRRAVGGRAVRQTRQARRYGNLALSGRRTSQQQVGDVGACNQENKSDGACEQTQVPSDELQRHLVKRPEPRGPALVGVGIRSREIGGDLPKLRARLLERHVRTNPSDDHRVPSATLRIRIGNALCGIHTSTSSTGNSKVRGSTAMISNGSLFNVSDRPTIDGSAPKRFCQVRWVRIAVRRAPGRSSPATNARPIVGCTPSMSKRWWTRRIQPEVDRVQALPSGWRSGPRPG